ncbi:MAG: hypothetical protein ABWY71_01840 [Candidatus Saccharimonadales bacterium]
MTAPVLRGVELLCPPPGAYGDPLYDTTYEHIAQRAAALGATLVRDERGDPTLHRSHFLDNPNAYTLVGVDPVIDKETKDIIENGSAFGVAVPGIEPYAATRGRQLPLPFVLAQRALSGGNGKYLIESEEQLGQVRAVLDSDREGLSDAGELYEVRRFIDTPSDHYTSYRVLTSPEDILAAGLLYSTHRKTHPRNLASSRLRSLLFTDRTRPPAFEDRRSPFYLESRDIRSNIEQGGGCIPLMGDNRRRLSRKEITILEAHGIDPKAPALPERIRRPALVVARKIGRVSGLLAGEDFLDDKELKTGWFLEHNSGPGEHTWNECWNGSAKIPAALALRQMHDAALDTIIAARSN